MSPRVTAVVLCSTLIDAALVAWTLFRARDSRIDLPRVVLAALALCVAMVAKFALARVFGATGFLAINFAYVNTFVLVPLFGLALLASARRREVDRKVRSLSWASLAVIPIGAYATFVEPYTLRTERASVPLAATRDGRSPITIAVLSDIQCVEVTDREREAVRRAMESQP